MQGRMIENLSQNSRHFALLVLLLLIQWNVAGAQETADTTSTAAEPSQPSWSQGDVIELDAVQIEGEIAQPNVTITVARQEPTFKDLTLERMPSLKLLDFEISEQDKVGVEAAKIKDWSEMLDRPRQ